MILKILTLIMFMLNFINILFNDNNKQLKISAFCGWMAALIGILINW